MAESCNLTQIKYIGNGRTTQFTFPFTYLHFYDVKAALWDESKREYIDQDNKFILSDASTVQFLTAPPEPPESAPDGLNVLIYRDTELETPQTVFYPGSSIRSKDLNDNFDQLRFSVQEVECGLENERADTQQKVWNRTAIKGRDDLQEPQPPYDTVYRNDQIAGRWYGDTEGTREDQEAVATTGAISERLDPYVQGSIPTETEVGFGHQEGKRWINTDDCWDSHWDKNADAWVAFTNNGPRGVIGPRGPQGTEGPVGPPLVIRGTIAAGDWVEPSPLVRGDIWIAEGEITNFPGGGTPQESDSLVWNGDRWVNLGPIGIEGQKGDKGDLGNQGIQGIEGPTGPQGPIGPEGDQGQPGTGVNFQGQVANSNDLPTGAGQNDAYQAMNTGHMWVWNGAVWIDVGPVNAGAAGPQGPAMDISTLPILPPKV